MDVVGGSCAVGVFGRRTHRCVQRQRKRVWTYAVIGLRQVGHVTAERQIADWAELELTFEAGLVGGGCALHLLRGEKAYEDVNSCLDAGVVLVEGRQIDRDASASQVHLHTSFVGLQLLGVVRGREAAILRCPPSSWLKPPALYPLMTHWRSRLTHSRGLCCDIPWRQSCRIPQLGHAGPADDRQHDRRCAQDRRRADRAARPPVQLRSRHDTGGGRA